MSDAVILRVRTRMFVREVLEDVFGQETTDAEVERIAERLEQSLGLKQATGED